MQIRLEAEATRWGTLTLKLHTKRESFHPLYARSVRREIILDMLEKVDWRLETKRMSSILFSAEVPEITSRTLIALFEAKRISKKQVERWRTMTVEQIYEEVLPHAIASSIKD